MTGPLSGQLMVLVALDVVVSFNMIWHYPFGATIAGRRFMAERERPSLEFGSTNSLQDNRSSGRQPGTAHTSKQGRNQ